MATPSLPPSSTPSSTEPPTPATASPPTTVTSPPPQPLSSPPPPNSTTTSPPTQPSGNSSDPPSPSVQSPPPQSPPPATPSAPLPATPSPPPPATPSAPPPTTPSPPPPQPPVTPTPPPQSPSPPPPSTRAPPPPVPGQPVRSPPPPPSQPPQSSPPPPASVPPTVSPPPPPSSVPLPPAHSPPPPDTIAPSTAPPPPPHTIAPSTAPPPPDATPPSTAPPPPHTIAPSTAPPPPDATPPSTATPPPPRRAPTPPASQPPLSPSNSSSPPSPPSPPPLIRLAPPPPLVLGPSSNDSAVNIPKPSAPESPDSPNTNGISTGALVAIGMVAGIVILSLIGLAVWRLRRRKRHFSGSSGGHVMPSPMGSSPRSDSAFLKIQSSAPLVGHRSSSDVYSPSEAGGLGHSKALFTYEELVKATNGFSSQNLLGEGGFGCVYKGLLPDGREVAVKQLKIGGGQGDREFKAEVETISRIHHRHLVSLVGYCISESRRLLIYDYVPNNNLYFHLHAEGRSVLDWARRVKIAAGAARGIAYLHEDCHPRIIHRDIKSSNILLDNNFEARVSDFGLAKLALDANTHITTRVMGTFGYMAPEYASSGKLTEKSDVFSFGVVLLELITGRKPVDVSQPLGDESLVEWARPLLSHALETEEFEALADPRLGGVYVDTEMFRMIEAAAACVRHSAAKRPRMGQVARAFDSLANEDLTNGMKLGESEIFNSAQQSAEIRLFRRMAFGFGSENYSTDFFTQNSWISRDENV